MGKEFLKMENLSEAWDEYFKGSMIQSMKREEPFISQYRWAGQGTIWSQLLFKQPKVILYTGEEDVK